MTNTTENNTKTLPFFFFISLVLAMLLLLLLCEKKSLFCTRFELIRISIASKFTKNEPVLLSVQCRTVFRLENNKTRQLFIDQTKFTTHLKQNRVLHCIWICI